MKHLRKALAMSIFLLSGIFIYSANAEGCTNQPSNNDGDCTEATSADGSIAYFCEDSFWFHDCVKSGNDRKEI